MSRSLLNVYSIKTRIIFVTLVMILVTNWFLAVNTNQVLREDMRKLLGEHQHSMVTMVANDINQHLELLNSDLSELATRISPTLKDNKSALVKLLAERSASMKLFNAGVVVYGQDGIALAESVYSTGRLGVSYLHHDYIRIPLQEGRSAIGEPRISNVSGRPEFVVAEPVRSAQGQVIGVVAGVVDLGRPNFLDMFSTSLTPRSDKYRLISPQYQLIVTTSDRSQVVQKMTAPALEGLLKQYLQGYKGSLVTVDPDNVEVLVSANLIPAVNWYLVAAMPTAEAFRPSQSMQSQIVLHAVSLTLIACLISWYVISLMLRRQLQPLLAAAKTLHTLPFENQRLLPLPITSSDEIGDLIAAFNHLLARLDQRDKAHVESEQRYRVMTEWSPVAITVHRHGRLIYVNPAAITLLGAQTAQDLQDRPLSALVPDALESTLVMQCCADSSEVCCPMREGKCLKLDQTVIDVEVRSTSIMFNGERAIHTVLRDITERKKAEVALKDSLHNQQALLHEVHHRVKNNLQVITSLLRLESGRSSEISTQLVLEDMQARIRSMALLHEILYHSASFATVELGAYLKELATQAFRAQMVGSVKLKLMIESIHVSLDQATPCGLLLNELISNSLKHGFPDGRGGEICIELSPESSSQWHLCVSDTGAGLPADFERRRTQSLGLQLVADLARQLGGALEISPGPLKIFTVRFSVYTTNSLQ